MRIILLTYYYPPDLCAGSFRAVGLADALGASDQVTVITTAPNRYATHVAPAPMFEQNGNIEVHRVAAGAHDGGMLAQSLNFVRFAAGALPLALKTDTDVVVATSSRLMTGVLGAVVATLKRRPLYLDIRDIFVDTIFDVIGRGALTALRPAFSLLERWMIGRARRINLVSPGFLPYFGERYPGRTFDVLSNGVDPEFVAAWTAARAEAAPRHDIFTVVYAGNVGEGQGLEHVLPEAARQLAGKARFVVYGDGGRMGALRARLADLPPGTVELNPPVARAELSAAYARADALLVHLNAHPAFLKVMPSKLFEYGATGLPIIAGVGGTAAEFLRQELPDTALFAPCDPAGLVAAVEHTMARATTNLAVAREEFTAKFLRPAISARLAEAIRSLGRSS